MKAHTLIPKGKTVIVIFTKGKHFERVKGWTGYWVINPNRHTDKIIIYERDRANHTNRVYVGDRTRRTERVSGGRYKIYFANLQPPRICKENWPEFTEGARNPIKYYD